MSIRRKWLEVVFLLLLAGASFFGGPINPRDIESVIRAMNETQIESSAPDEAGKNGCDPPP